MGVVGGTESPCSSYITEIAPWVFWARERKGSSQRQVYIIIVALTSNFVEIGLFKPVVLNREAVRYVVVIFQSRIEGALKSILENGLVLYILFKICILAPSCVQLSRFIESFWCGDF